MERPQYKRVPSASQSPSSKRSSTSLKLRLTTLVVFLFAVGAWLILVRPQQGHGVLVDGLEDELDTLKAESKGKVEVVTKVGAFVTL